MKVQEAKNFLQHMFQIILKLDWSDASKGPKLDPAASTIPKMRSDSSAQTNR